MFVKNISLVWIIQCMSLTCVTRLSDWYLTYSSFHVVSPWCWSFWGFEFSSLDISVLLIFTTMYERINLLIVYRIGVRKMYKWKLSADATVVNYCVEWNVIKYVMFEIIKVFILTSDLLYRLTSPYLTYCTFMRCDKCMATSSLIRIMYCFRNIN